MSKFGSNAPLTERFKYDPCSISEEELLDALQELEQFKIICKVYNCETYKDLDNYIMDITT